MKERRDEKEMCEVVLVEVSEAVQMVPPLIGWWRREHGQVLL
jgi:hypothetical protein